MSQQELLKRVVDLLNQASIPYMVTGSLVSSLQGEPRSTHDIDLVVFLKPEDVGKLVQGFPPPDFFLSESAIHEAMRHRSMFNLLSLVDGEKVDFWILTDEPFDQERFSRKRIAKIADMHLHVSAPEDTILVKLRWAKLSGGSEKQFSDALRVFELQHSGLDLNYLENWAVRLGVEELWQRLQKEAEPV